MAPRYYFFSPKRFAGFPTRSIAANKKKSSGKKNAAAPAYRPVQNRHGAKDARFLESRPLVDAPQHPALPPHGSALFQERLRSRLCSSWLGHADRPGRATHYSRKPGLTETRLRPLARRRDKTFWPPWVFMRVRNPCFLDRLRRLGWTVRLGMKSSCS